MSTNASRVALITGSTSGIGLAIARRLAANGYTVALHSRSSEEQGIHLSKELKNASYTRADLADEESARQLVHRVLDCHGRLDVLVNNAAMGKVIAHNDLHKASPEIWRQIYEVNVVAPWILITEAEAALRQAAASGEKSSSILNITSHAGIRPKGASIPYAVSKAALNHMTQLLALNLGPHIRVNAIAPGLVDTPLTADWDWARKIWQEKAPMGRGASAEEIADIAAMTVESNYLTGEVIVVDGGLHLT